MLSRNAVNTPVAAPPATTPATAAAPVTSAAPATTTPRRTTAAPTTTPAPTSAQPAPGGNVADPVGFVQGYYGLLPGQAGAAFALLSPQAQAQSGGAQGYANFWGGMSAVSLSDVRRTGTGTVNATVRFVRKDGTTTNEPYQFVVGADGGGKTILQSFSRV